MDKKLVLIGDSVFDNRAYVGDGIDVITHVRESLGSESAQLFAVDGSVVNDVAGQLQKVSEDSTHLVLSVGGNNGLENADVLSFEVENSAQVFSRVSDIAKVFENQYAQMLETVLALGIPLTVCTIYFPRMPEPFFQKISVAALASFNDVIIRQATMRGLPIIDLRLVCDEDADFANEIEPSEQGGRKIADAIINVINNHDFGSRQTTIYK